MANFNKVILAGNLTRDPQLSYLPSSTPVCEFGMAINHRWRGQDEQMRDETCFVDLSVFGKQAETFKQYMTKGQAVLIEGRLKYDAWEGKDGTKRNKLRVVVDRFQFLGAPGADGSRPGAAAGPPARAAAPASDYAPSAPAYAPPAPAYAPSVPEYEELPPPMEESPPPAGEEIPF